MLELAETTGSKMTDVKGGVVASAKAAKVSITRLIQRSCTAFKGDSVRYKMPMNSRIKTEKLQVI